MAVKSKTGVSATRLTGPQGCKKSTSQGQGQHSKPRRKGRKKLVGQGR